MQFHCCPCPTVHCRRLPNVLQINFAAFLNTSSMTIALQFRLRRDAKKEREDNRPQSQKQLPTKRSSDRRSGNREGVGGRDESVEEELQTYAAVVAACFVISTRSPMVYLAACSKLLSYTPPLPSPVSLPRLRRLPPPVLSCVHCANLFGHCVCFCISCGLSTST